MDFDYLHEPLDHDGHLQHSGKPPPVIEDPGSSTVSEHKQFLKGSSIMSSVFP